jgi:hypothetical protein
MSDTPRTQKAYTLSYDNTGAVTRMEPIWDEMQALERELNAFHDELSKVMPSDYKDWWQNSKAEWPLVARVTIENLREREQSALEDLERLERELNEARDKIEATASLKIELGNRNSEICKLRSINAELRKASIDLLKSLPIVGCSELHHEKADQHTFMEDCPVLLRYKSAIYQMRITLAKSKNKP